MAIIGASRQPGSVGQSLLANVIDSRYLDYVPHPHAVRLDDYLPI